MTQTKFSKDVVALAGQFKLQNGRLQLSPARLSAVEKKHRTLNARERDAMRVELIALALQFKTLGEPAHFGIEQLSTLIAALLPTKATTPPRQK